MPAIHPSLAAWYRGENSAADASGNGNNGTWSGTEAYAAGKLGNTLSLNGSSSISRASWTPAAAATLCAWVKAGAASTVGYIFAIDNPTGARRYNFAWVGTSNVIRVLDLTTNRESAASFGGTDWTHAAVTISGTAVAFYKNGIAAGTATLTSAMTDAAGTLRVGSRDGAVFFTGQIDEAMIFHRALAAHEIRALYATGSPLGLLK